METHLILTAIMVSFGSILNVYSNNHMGTKVEWARTSKFIPDKTLTPCVQMESARILEAAKKRNLTAIKLFMETSKNVDSETRTVLDGAIAEIATRNGDLIMLKYVLEKSRSILKNRILENYTLLRFAIRGGFLNTVRYLVDHCAAEIFKAHCHTTGDTYVHLAAELGRLDILKYFVEVKKADVNLKNELGQPLLFAAARGARLNVIRYMVEERDVNVKMLDSLGRNVFSYSAQKGDLKTPAYLLDERKLKIKINNTIIIHDAITHTARLRSSSRTAFMKYFIEEKHVNINTRDKGGRIPLHWAILTNQYESVKFLIEHGADINARDNYGRTSLHEAVTMKSSKICRYLIEHGADIQLKDCKGQTPLHFATREGRLSNVKYLIERGANIQSADKDGRTTLHQAAVTGELSVVKYLVQHGADIQQKDTSGKTPSNIAANEIVMTYLRRREVILLRRSSSS